MSVIDRQSLAAAVRAKRGDRGLRATAAEIGQLSPSTLSRVEGAEKPPDLETYARLCRWLGVSWDSFAVLAWDQRVRANLIAAGCDDPEVCAGACLANRRQEGQG